MIFDSLDNLNMYLPDGWSEEVLQYTKTVTTDVSDGERAIRENTIFSRIMTLATVQRKRGVLESHRSFVDIQIVIAGQEIIEVWPTSQLKENIPYDGIRDVGFYEVPEMSHLQFVLNPGFFAIFFPQDAHMPQIAIGEEAPLKKMVLKVSVSLFPRGVVRGATSSH